MRNRNKAIVLKGEAKGVKDGGVLEQILRELEIEALPLDIPEKISIDISELEIGSSIHVSDISVSDKVKITTSSEETIATVVAKVEEPQEEEEEVLGAEAPAEPEVIKEKKEEGES